MDLPKSLEELAKESRQTYETYESIESIQTSLEWYAFRLMLVGLLLIGLTAKLMFDNTFNQKRTSFNADLVNEKINEQLKKKEALR